jgi:hypothetical protein
MLIITLWSRVLIKKLTVAQLIKTYPSYGTRMFITVIIRALYRTISCTR